MDHPDHIFAFLILIFPTQQLSAKSLLPPSWPEPPDLKGLPGLSIKQPLVPLTPLLTAVSPALGPYKPHSEERTLPGFLQPVLLRSLFNVSCPI